MNDVSYITFPINQVPVSYHWNKAMCLIFTDCINCFTYHYDVVILSLSVCVVVDHGE